jgi:predicted RND superfamily exporter protein
MSGLLSFIALIGLGVAMGYLGYRSYLRERRREAERRYVEAVQRIARHFEIAAAVIAVAFTPAVRQGIEAFKDFAASMEKMQRTLDGETDPE